MCLQRSMHVERVSSAALTLRVESHDAKWTNGLKGF